MSQTKDTRGGPPAPPGHPDLAEIEAVRTGEAAPGVAEHVRACYECRAALDELGGIAGSVKAAAAAQRIEFPAGVDEAVSAAIDQRVRAITSGRLRLRVIRWAAPLAAAATVLLAVGLWTASTSHRKAPAGDGSRSRQARREVALLTEGAADAPHAASTPATAAAGFEAEQKKPSDAKRLSPATDIDGNGSIDIVDAYLIARAVRGGGRLERRWDINRDGKVDGRDVDAVARRAVSVGRGGA